MKRALFTIVLLAGASSPVLAQVTFARDVAPILQRSCQNCHHAGAIAPMSLVTKSLLVAGEGGVFTTPSGQRGAMLRAYDKKDGHDVGAVYMPAPQSGSPMTYMWNGKQYIVVAISGGNYSGELLAFRLPG